MKKIPGLRNDFGELYEKLLTNQETNLFFAAIDLGIFQELSDWRSPGELVEKLRLNRQNTMVFLDSLVSCNLIEKKGGRFRNLPAAEGSLALKNVMYLGDCFLTYYYWYNMSPGRICNLVRNSPAESGVNDMNSEDLWAEQARLSVHVPGAGMAQLATRLVSSLHEYPSFQKMLDLGCGSGLFGTSIAMSHPSMKAVLFDRPAVARVAREVVDAYEVGDRIEVAGGDYINDPIGGDYDLVWASETLHFAGKHLDEVVKKIYDALNPGGVFISFSNGKTDDGTIPKEMTLRFPMPALFWDDMGLNEGVIAESMIKAGFASVQSRTVMTPIGEMAVDIARKRS